MKDLIEKLEHAYEMAERANDHNAMASTAMSMFYVRTYQPPFGSNYHVAEVRAECTCQYGEACTNCQGREHA